MVPNSHLKSLLYQSLSKYVSRSAYYYTWFISFTIPKALLTEGLHWIRDLYFAKTVPAPVFNFPDGLGFAFTSFLQHIYYHHATQLYILYPVLHSNASFNS